MFKNIISLFLLVFSIALTSQSLAITEPAEPTDTKLETDSTHVKNRQLKTSKERPKVNTSAKANDTKIAFWESDKDEEEDSDSALSFNFIYYIIEKFKFQVE